MRNYFLIKEQPNSLVVSNSNGFLDLPTGIAYDTKDVELVNLESEMGNSCLSMIEKEASDYMIAGYNEEYVVIQNKGRRILTIRGAKHNISWSYRLNKVNGNRILPYDNLSIRYNRYTAFPWKVFYQLLAEMGEGNIIKFEDLKRRRPKQIKKEPARSVKLSKHEQMLVKQAIMYSKRIYNLTNKVDLDADELKELDQYMDIRPNLVTEIMDGLDKNYQETLYNLKLAAVGKQSYREVINSFKL